jgi:fructuronate reductase
LPTSIARPDYDPGSLTAGIVHLGIGAFHRAHQAVYTDGILKADPTWAIAGASLRTADTRDALKPQDCLYTLDVRSGEGERLRIIGSVIDVLVAASERERVLAAMSDPRVRVVSLTITEKGYCHDPATGALNEAHPDVVHDLSAPHAPRTAIGLIVEAAVRRRAAAIKPFTVLTCDNLPANGRLVKRLIDRFATLRDPDLGAFVAGEVLCPATMVDRITPATTDEDREAIAASLDVVDRWPIVTEPFSQWVIEDNFASGRPRWEDAGAELVDNVEPYELMKLRLLNGAHSSLAYLGYLAGYETVSDVLANADFERFVRGLMEEATPTLSVPPSTDLSAYKTALIRRFKNPALKHRTWQIAMDGSQKLPQRLLGTIRDCLRLGLPFDHLTLGVAAWMRYVTGVDEKGRAIDIHDPLATHFREITDVAGSDAKRLVPALLEVEPIFGKDLRSDSRFSATVTAKLEGLMALGAKQTVASVR